MIQLIHNSRRRCLMNSFPYEGVNFLKNTRGLNGLGREGVDVNLFSCARWKRARKSWWIFNLVRDDIRLVREKSYARVPKWGILRSIGLWKFLPRLMRALAFITLFAFYISQSFYGSMIDVLIFFKSFFSSLSMTCDRKREILYCF